MDEIVARVILLQKPDLSETKIPEHLSAILEQIKTLQDVRIAHVLMNILTEQLKSSNHRIITLVLSIVLALPISLKLQIRADLTGFILAIFKWKILEYRDCHELALTVIKLLLTPKVADQSIVEAFLMSVTPSCVSPQEVSEILHILSLLDSSILCNLSSSIDRVFTLYYPNSSSLPSDLQELRLSIYQVVQTQHSSLFIHDSSPIHSRLNTSATSVLGEAIIPARGYAPTEEIHDHSLLSHSITSPSHSATSPHPSISTPYPSILAYFPWVLLILLGVSSLFITFLIVRDTPPSVKLTQQPNFDSTTSYVPPVEAEIITVIHPSMPHIREEEDAFVIEEGTDEEYLNHDGTQLTSRQDDLTVDLFDDSTMENHDLSLEEPSMGILDNMVVDLPVTSGSTLTSSLFFLLLVVVAIALWIRFQSRSPPHPIPSTPYHHRSSVYHPTTADLPPITPCPDSLELNRRSTNRFDSNVL